MAVSEATLPVTGIILPPKGHAVAIKRDQPVIADRNAVGRASELPQHGGGSATGWFHIDHPIGAKQRVHERAPVSGVAPPGVGATEIELAVRIRPAHLRAEFTSKCVA